MELANLYDWNVLIPWLTAMVFGVFVGSTPGLTATMAVALIVPISYYMSPEAGIAMVIGVSFTAIFAGDIPATYLRIPGTPASVLKFADVERSNSRETSSPREKLEKYSEASVATPLSVSRQTTHSELLSAVALS